jgi:putative SOS response-associated peptidase YedK
MERLSMSGRYASFADAITLSERAGVNLLPNLAPPWNVAPTQGVAVVRRHPTQEIATSTC